MTSVVERPDVETVSRFLAKRIVHSYKSLGTQNGVAVVEKVVTVLQEEDLAQAIGEIELETQILGASFLKVEIIDPEGTIAASGLIDVNPEGILQPVEVEYPEGSGWDWVLCAAEVSTDPSQPNLILTFEDKFVTMMREQFGPKLTAAGTQTRAQFIKSLVLEAIGAGHFVCPSLNVIQPVKSTAENALGTAVVSTAIERSRTERHENKSRGISRSANVTIKGQTPTDQQLADLNTALGVAQQLGAGEQATLALICAGIGESNFERSSTDSVYGTHHGIWQSDVIPGDQVAKQAEYFLKGGESFGAGGAIAKAKEGKSPGQIATEVEVSGEPASFYGKWLAEAKAIVHAYGGVSGEAAGSASSPAGETKSDVGVLHRGSRDNPEEDSWECAVRLAHEVMWYFFTGGHKAFRNGTHKSFFTRKVFYMSGPDLIGQEPALYVEVFANRVRKPDGSVIEGALNNPSTCTFDNETFYYRRGHKLRGRVQRKSRISKPQTPSEIRLDLTCEEAEFAAGDREAGIPKHVTVYIGGGQVISMGQQGDPSQGEAAAMGPDSILGYRTYPG